MPSYCAASNLKGFEVASACSTMASDVSGHLGHCLMGQARSRTAAGSHLGHCLMSQRLLEYGAPFVLLQMAKYMADRVRSHGRDLDLVEVFSGKGELSKSFAEVGCKVASYEIEQNPKMCDLASDVGLLHAVGLVPLCQKMLGQLGCSPVCFCYRALDGYGMEDWWPGHALEGRGLVVGRCALQLLGLPEPAHVQAVP